MRRLCTWCRKATETRTVARGEGFTFERCECGGTSFVRTQVKRGTVHRAGLIEDVAEVAGEFIAVEKFAPKGWDERWAREVA